VEPWSIKLRPFLQGAKLFCFLFPIHASVAAHISGGGALFAGPLSQA
jgi:hypothetical protein